MSLNPLNNNNIQKHNSQRSSTSSSNSNSPDAPRSLLEFFKLENKEGGQIDQNASSSPKVRSKTLKEYSKSAPNPTIDLTNILHPPANSYSKFESKDDKTKDSSPPTSRRVSPGILNSATRSLSLTSTIQLTPNFPTHVATRDEDLEKTVGSLEMREHDKQNLLTFLDSLIQIQKMEDEKQLLDILKKFNTINFTDTGRALYFLRNHLICDKNISPFYCQVHLTHLYSILDECKKEMPQVIKVFQTLAFLQDPEELSLQILTKFSEHTIPMLHILIQKEILLEESIEKLHFWSVVLGNIQDHCLLTDILEEKSLFVVSCNRMLLQLKKNNDLKNFIEQISLDIRKHLSKRIKRLFERSNLNISSVVAVTVDFVFLQYHFLKDTPSGNVLLEKFIGNVLSGIYENIFLSILEPQKKDLRLQQFCKHVASETIAMMGESLVSKSTISRCASGAIITQIALNKEDVIPRLAFAIFDQTRKSDEVLFAFIFDCCECEAEYEKVDSVFRNKTVSFEISNLFASSVNKSFNADVIKLLKKHLSLWKDASALCINAIDIHEYEHTKNKQWEGLEKLAFDNIVVSMNEDELKKELSAIDIDSLPKLKNLVRPNRHYDPKNFAMFFDCQVGELSANLKKSLMKLIPECGDLVSLSSLPLEPVDRRLLYHVEVNELPEWLFKEIKVALKLTEKEESQLLCDLPLEKLSQQLMAKINAEVSESYKKFFYKLVLDVIRIKEKKVLLVYFGGFKRIDLEKVLSQVKFSHLSPKFRLNICDEICRLNEPQFTLFLTGFLKEFYEMRLSAKAQHILALRKKVIANRFPKLELPLVANMLFLRWIIPNIINNREWDKHPYQKSVIKTLTAILQKMSTEYSDDIVQSWTSVYLKVSKGYSEAHRKFIEANSTFAWLSK